jgi:nucleotide-binding universal stress UspA family protein
MAERDGRPAGFSILVGVDFEEPSGYALEQAARIAIAIPNAQLHVLHVLEAHATEERGREVARDLRAYVTSRAAALGGLHGLRVGIHVRVGDAPPQIADVVSDVGANLVVLGHGKGSQLKTLLLGSTAEKVMASVAVPVFLVGQRHGADQVRVPVIDPPCPDCLRARNESAGQRWWCERHSQHHLTAHAFSYQRELPFGTHDSEFIPAGISPERVR